MDTSQAQTLLKNLQSRGFVLSADGSDLFVKPKAELTFADRTAIRDNKPGLLELLKYQFCDPYITEFGELRIPFNAHPRYHWWNGGQSIITTLVELNAPWEVFRLYVARGPHLLTSRHSEICAGELKRAHGVVYCAECRYFIEEAA